MLRRRILYIIALILALLGQLLDVGYLFHFTFFAVLCLPVLGLLVSLPAMLGCRTALTASALRISRGEPVSRTLSVSNRFRLPLARASYRLRVVNLLTGEVHSGRSILRDMAEEEDRVWWLETDHCGAVECRVERLWVCDCLGLFSLPARAPEPAVILVAPVPEHPGLIELPEGAGTSVPLPRGRTVYGENYELRPYREGDSLRMIHWKMSAKRDELVTREPPEDTRPLPVLTFDHFGLMDQVDRTLDRLEGYSLALLERDRPHEVRWAHPETGVVRTFRITGERDWEICLAAVLSDHAPLRGRSILESSLTLGQEPVYQIHISGKEEPDGSA